jgi:tetraacyldisaccharide 4'-kinase
VKHVRAHGWVVGVISRGFGRKSSACLEVTDGATVYSVGDEPILIFQQTRCPVFVASRRIDAARALLARYPDTTLLICDDGLTHYALWRDVEVCVFDERELGNGCLLPAGLLREPWPRPKLLHCGSGITSPLILTSGSGNVITGFSMQRELSTVAKNSYGMQKTLADLMNLGLPVCACAGIAKPHMFFQMLSAHGVQLTQKIALPDHYDYADFDISSMNHVLLLCTEKDAVKLWERWPSAWAVVLNVTLEPDFYQAFDVRISKFLPT